MKWKTDKQKLVEIEVPIQTSYGKGTYFVWAQKRPDYCDRGDWQINVNPLDSVAASCIDDQDGFPRYFFGDKVQVKEQIETWIMRREETVKNE